MKDYYSILGISPQAGSAEVRKAYLQLAKVYHPDKNGDTEDSKQKFQEIQEAHEILSDPLRRAEYDRHRIAGAGQWQSFTPQDLFREIRRKMGKKWLLVGLGLLVLTAVAITVTVVSLITGRTRKTS